MNASQAKKIANKAARAKANERAKLQNEQERKEIAHAASLTRYYKKEIEKDIVVSASSGRKSTSVDIYNHRCLPALHKWLKSLGYTSEHSFSPFRAGIGSDSYDTEEHYNLVISWK